uniref:DUF1353 domain-containing protein n=1 Tax=viral metagenome TaxID=1070528 RepID=A0A6M3KLB1_9ZZZZ
MIILNESLKAEDLVDGRHRRLLEDYTVMVDVRGSRLPITVPRGFVSDGGSVPWGCWNLAAPWGDYSAAFVVHDWLYYQGAKILPRAGADWVLYAMMETLDEIQLKPASTLSRRIRAVGRLARRRAVYQAVRLGGGVAWENHRRRETGK